MKPKPILVNSPAEVQSDRSQLDQALQVVHVRHVPQPEIGDAGFKKSSLGLVYHFQRARRTLQVAAALQLGRLVVLRPFIEGLGFRVCQACQIFELWNLVVLFMD